MLKNGLLNPNEFEIEEDYYEDKEKCVAACKRLIDSWSSELETQMLEAFIKLYYDEMVGLKKQHIVFNECK